jgi:hypothetical protein
VLEALSGHDVSRHVDLWSIQAIADVVDSLQCLGGRVYVRRDSLGCGRHRPLERSVDSVIDVAVALFFAAAYARNCKRIFRGDQRPGDWEYGDGGIAAITSQFYSAVRNDGFTVFWHWSRCCRLCRRRAFATSWTERDIKPDVRGPSLLQAPRVRWRRYGRNRKGAGRLMAV